jgi:hypothetical protein
MNEELLIAIARTIVLVIGYMAFWGTVAYVAVRLLNRFTPINLGTEKKRTRD